MFNPVSSSVNNMTTNQIFIIGMPRSGTKLLRGLLNKHPKLSFLSGETEFLPYLDKYWQSWEGKKGLANFDNFLQFYFYIIKLPYFISKSYQGKLIEPQKWYDLCEDYTLSGVFEALARHDANAYKDMIWGDKSPSYIRHIPLIKKHFPEAKILHIIRDVRDYCLSINKAWGKNMLRAAQRWADDVAKARKDGEKFENDYFEIRYEDLLEDPHKDLQNVCSFLCVNYYQDLIELEKPTENIGDAKSQSGIIKMNTKKYNSSMTTELRRKIEHITFPELLKSGYQAESFLRQKKLTEIEKKLYQLQDGVQLVKARRHTGKSLFESVNFYLKAFKQSK